MSYNGICFYMVFGSHSLAATHDLRSWVWTYRKVLKMKLWLKHNPGITAETLSEEQLGGGVPVKVHNSNPTDGSPVDTYAIIYPHEWSDVEITTAPDPVPSQGYLVLYGDDPAAVKYEFHVREIDAAKAMVKKKNAFGYVSVTIARNAMIPVE